MEFSCRHLPIPSHSDTADGVCLSARERRALLDDIARIGLLLGRALSGPNFAAATGKGDAPVAPLERLALLTALSREALPVLRCAASAPHSTLLSAVCRIPLPQARGGHHTATRLARSPQSLSWRQAARTSHALLVSELRPQITTDTPANRFLVTLLKEWEREIRTLCLLSDWCGETEAAREGYSAAAALQAELRRPEWQPLRTLSAKEKSEMADCAARWPAAHRALFGLWGRAQQGLHLDWSPAPLLSLPARPDWYLYEIWCFLQTAAALQSAGWHLRRGDAIAVTVQGVRLNLTTGRESRLHFMASTHRESNSYSDSTLTLTYQPLFPSANRTPGLRPTSRTHAMQPDMMLEWRGKIYLLDPKYRNYERPDPASETNFVRQSNALLDDINKMHTYRDAITLAGRPVVQAAWCLTPGGPNADRDVVAYPHSNAASPFGTAGVGAIRLRPGASDETLRRLLHSWLSP